MSHEVIGAAIEVHRQMGSGLIESIYERCMLRELEVRSIPATTQQLVRIDYKGVVFDEPLRFATKGCRSFASIQQSTALQLHEAVRRAGRVAHQFP